MDRVNKRIDEILNQLQFIQMADSSYTKLESRMNLIEELVFRHRQMAHKLLTKEKEIKRLQQPSSTS